MLDNYRSVQFLIPIWGQTYPGGSPFEVALVHRKYPKTTPPQMELCKLHDSESIERNETDGVCRVWTGPRNDPKSRSLIVKFAVASSDARHSSLEREAEIYCDHLQSLQGVVIPTFFGLFEGQEVGSFLEESLRVTCIILEDCGEDLEHIFSELPLADRAQIIRKVGRIHQCGVSLDDFAERNVVEKGGVYRLIDFQHVETGHKCSWKNGSLHEGEVVPKVSEIGCAELHDLGLEFGLWKMRHTVSIFGKNRPKRDFPSQESIDTLCKGLVSFHFDNEQRLHNWIKNYKQYEIRGTMTAEQYMTQFKRPDVARSPKELGPDEYAK